MTILISVGALFVIGIVVAIVLAVRSASGGQYGHHGRRRH